jgi:hypothetical protein
LLVIGNDDPGVRLVAAEDHVAAGLAAEDEPSVCKCRTDFKTGQIGRELSHVAILRAGTVFTYAASISTNSFPASVGTGSPASRQSSM